MKFRPALRVSQEKKRRSTTIQDQNGSQIVESGYLVGAPGINLPAIKEEKIEESVEIKNLFHPGMQ